MKEVGMYEPVFLGPQVPADVVAARLRLLGQKCPECQRDLVSQEDWFDLDRQDRNLVRSQLAPYGGRTLCRSCRIGLSKRNPDKLLDYPSKLVPLDVFAEEYQTLRARGVTENEIQRVLNMTYAAFRKALSRAKEKGLL